MPAGLYPFVASSHCELDIHSKRFHRCSTRRGLPDDSSPILTPPKMPRPFLISWIEKASAMSGHRINSVCLAPLVYIAGTTRKPQILLTITAASSTWDNVIDLQS